MPRRIELGTPFEISAGETIDVDGYSLSALRIPAARQNGITLRRPSGDFSLTDQDNATATFTLHGYERYFHAAGVLVKILMQKRENARCVIWPAPPITSQMAIDIAHAHVTKAAKLDEGSSGSLRVAGCGCLHVVWGEKRLAWSIYLVTKDRFYRHNQGGPGWGLREVVVIDAISGDVLRPPWITG